MTVSTIRFERAHGKKPRGYGYWYFTDKSGEFAYDNYGLYSEVKKEAIKAARNWGLTTIYAES